MKRLLLATCWLVIGCDGAPEPSATGAISGELSLEIRDTVQLSIEPRANGEASFELTPSAGYGLLKAGATIQASGHITALTEASATLYEAELDYDADPPCGDVTRLGLTLHRQGNNAAVFGGIAVYCGTGVDSSVPVRVLRLAGQLPK